MGKMSRLQEYTLHTLPPLVNVKNVVTNVEFADFCHTVKPNLLR